MTILTNARIYTLIQQKSAENRVPRHLGALLLAGDNNISFQKYATTQEANATGNTKRNITERNIVPPCRYRGRQSRLGPSKYRKSVTPS